jgi:Protein of unknown function (DUF3631)
VVVGGVVDSRGRRGVRRGTGMTFIDRLAGKLATLGEMLTALDRFIRKYVVLTKHQATIVTLWVVHTHVIAAADCTPYLQITSATKPAGKTLLLEVMEPLVARPWLTGRTSAAVLVRKTDAERPTLLLDESDAAFNGEKEYAEALRGILNTGYRTSGKASLCVGQGANLTYKDFHTLAPKRSRASARCPARLPIAPFRSRSAGRRATSGVAGGVNATATPLGQHLVAWATKDVIAQLHRARPARPAIADDRKIDVLEPLFAIADAAAGDWPDWARQAALALVATADDTDSVVELLTDLKPILDQTQAAVIPTADLVASLVAMDDRPWATWRHQEKPITGRGLARAARAARHPTRSP